MGALFSDLALPLSLRGDLPLLLLQEAEALRWRWFCYDLRLVADFCLGDSTCSRLPCLPHLLASLGVWAPGLQLLRVCGLRGKAGCVNHEPGPSYSEHTRVLVCCRAWATSTPRGSYTRTSSPRMSSTTTAKW